MIIGIDIRALGQKKVTGIGNYIVNSLKYIFELDKVNNYYLLSSGLRSKIDPDIKFKQENVSYIHVSIPNKILNLSLKVGFCRSLNKFFPEKIDLLWLPNINFYKFDQTVPTILTIHDLSFLHSREFYSLKRRIWHRFINVDQLASEVDKIIAVSENTRRDIIRFLNIPKEKISMIYPGVEVNKMDREKAAQLIAPFNLKRKYFIFVGTLEPRKNISGLIKAFDRYRAKYEDTDLVIVGSKGWIYRSLINKINKRQYIHYLGYINGPTKDALYYLSQGLIWPSFYEGFGFPPLEAAYHGVPVIVSYKTSLPEVMKQQALYIDPYNSSDIYQALKQLTVDRALREQFKVSGKHFSVPNWTREAKKIIRLFESFNKNK